MERHKARPSEPGSYGEIFQQLIVACGSTLDIYAILCRKDNRRSAGIQLVSESTVTSICLTPEGLKEMAQFLLNIAKELESVRIVSDPDANYYYATKDEFANCMEDIFKSSAVYGQGLTEQEALKDMFENENL